MVDATRSKIVSVRADDPNRPIILTGVGVSAAIACQVSTFEYISTLITFYKHFNKTYATIFLIYKFH